MLVVFLFQRCIHKKINKQQYSRLTIIKRYHYIISCNITRRSNTIRKYTFSLIDCKSCHVLIGIDMSSHSHTVVIPVMSDSRSNHKSTVIRHVEVEVKPSFKIIDIIMTISITEKRRRWNQDDSPRIFDYLNI